jgi:hypothetical protein
VDAASLERRSTPETGDGPRPWSAGACGGSPSMILHPPDGQQPQWCSDHPDHHEAPVRRRRIPRARRLDGTSCSCPEEWSESLDPGCWTEPEVTA